MKRFQRGEAMVVVMLIMVAVLHLWSGPMGMFGHASHGDDSPASSNREMSGDPYRNR